MQEQIPHIKSFARTVLSGSLPECLQGHPRKGTPVIHRLLMLCIPVELGTAYSVGYVVDLFTQNKEKLKVHENTPVDMYSCNGC